MRYLLFELKSTSVLFCFRVPLSIGPCGVWCVPTKICPAEFIGFIESQHHLHVEGEPICSHDELMANFFAQVGLFDGLDDSVSFFVRVFMFSFVFSFAVPFSCLCCTFSCLCATFSTAVPVFVLYLDFPCQTFSHGSTAVPSSWLYGFFFIEKLYLFNARIVPFPWLYLHHTYSLACMLPTPLCLCRTFLMKTYTLSPYICCIFSTS